MASISASTPSRIENIKQSLEVRLFLQLVKVLDADPAGILSSDRPDADSKAMVERISSLAPRDRVTLWHGLADARRSGRRRRRETTSRR